MGGPVTVTDPDMTRFFMSLEQAVGLIFKAAEMMHGREIFILKMPVAKLKDIATAVIEKVKDINKINSEIPIDIIGRRHGERMHEMLLARDESINALEADDMFIILPDDSEVLIEDSEKLYAGVQKTTINTYESQDLDLMTVEDIKKMILL